MACGSPPPDSGSCPAARDLLDAASDLVASARDLALPEHVRIGVAADLEDGVPGLLRGLADGGTPVVPTVTGSVEVVDLLRDGLLDVGLVRHPGVLDGLTAGPVLLDARSRTPGPTGVAMLLDDVVLTARDTVRLMLAVSDNACGDALLALVGRSRVHDRLAALGLPETLVRQGSAEETRAVLRDTGAGTWAAAQRALADPDHVAETTQYDPAFASAATAAQLGQVLRVLWSRHGPAYDLVRDAMAHQAWRHRIGSGFPHDDVAVLGKTATLGVLRHEAAVVRFPHEHPVAVVVLTRSGRPERHLPAADSAVGELARLAVGPLRLPDDTAR